MPPSVDLAAALPVVDARGLQCPWPVLRAQRAMRTGDPFILLADDPMALTDVPLMAQQQGWTTKVSGLTDAVFQFIVAQGASSGVA